MPTTVDTDGHRFTITESGPAGEFVSTFYAPRLKFRIIRGPLSNYKVVYYATKERRNERAQFFANKDGDTVLCEVWTEDIACNADPINQGWALDWTMSPEVNHG